MLCLIKNFKNPTLDPTKIVLVEISKYFKYIKWTDFYRILKFTLWQLLITEDERFKLFTTIDQC